MTNKELADMVQDAFDAQWTAIDWPTQQEDANQQCRELIMSFGPQIVKALMGEDA